MNGVLRCMLRKRRLPGFTITCISSSSVKTTTSPARRSVTWPHALRSHEFLHHDGRSAAACVMMIRHRSLVSATHPLDHSAAAAAATLSTAPASRQSGDGYRELLRWTEAVLHPARTPLGSIKAEAWRDILMAMQVWLGHAPTEASTSAAPAAVAAVVPRHVDLVDRLLVRLFYEHSTHTKNRASRTWQEHDEQLQLWTVVTLQSWLDVSANFPDAPMAVHKAATWWDTLHKKWPAALDLAGVPLFVSLVQAHQRLVDTTGVAATRAQACQTVADMLLAETTLRNIVPFCEYDLADQLKAAYQLALRQTLELVSAENSKERLNSANTTITSIDFANTASVIMEQMEQLALIPGWSDVRFQDEELDKVLDALFLDGIKDESKTQKKTLSPFERQALQQRIVTRIDQASTVEDQETVEDLVLYWRSNMQDTEKEATQWKPFAKSVTNYYLRIQDPVKSTKWMQIQEQMPSTEVVKEAIQSSGSTPSPGQVGAIADETSQFEELEALNRVFAENEQERINQKLNLLDIWVTKVDSPIVPWRATEILESLEAEQGVTLSAQTYVTVVKLWLLSSTSATGIASQKALDIAMRCPEFDIEILSIVMQIWVDRQSSEKSPTVAAMNLVALLEENFNSIPSDQVGTMVENAFRLLAADKKQSRKFLDFLLNKGVPMSAEIAHAAIKSNPDNVVPLTDLLELELNDGVRMKLGFDFYRAAIFNLLGLPQAPQRVGIMTRLLYDALGLAGDGLGEDRGNELLELVYNVLNHITSKAKDQTLAATIMEKTEAALLKKPFNSSQGSSPIPLDFYRRVVVLFSENGMIQHIEQVMDRLKEHHRAGFLDLHPDNAIYNVYLRALRETDRSNSLDKRIELLHELAAFYETGNREIDHYKPDYFLFDALVSDLNERAKLIDGSAGGSEKNTDAAEFFEKDSLAAVALLGKMHSLGIAPKNPDRVYPFNVAMELVLSSQNVAMHYKIVMTLKQQMEDLQIVPNVFTSRAVLRACEHACERPGNNKNFQVLILMLQMLTEIRSLGKADPGTFSLCFKVLLHNRRQLSSTWEKTSADRMLETVFQCCLDDGCLTNSARTTFRTLSSPQIHQKLYEDRLVGGKEPKAWTRNCGKVFERVTS